MCYRTRYRCDTRYGCQEDSTMLETGTPELTRAADFRPGGGKTIEVVGGVRSSIEEVLQPG